MVERPNNLPSIPLEEAHKAVLSIQERLSPAYKRRRAIEAQQAKVAKRDEKILGKLGPTLGQAYIDYAYESPATTLSEKTKRRALVEAVVESIPSLASLDDKGAIIDGVYTILTAFEIRTKRYVDEQVRISEDIIG